MSTSLSVGKDTNKRAKIQIIFEFFQAEVSSTLVKYTKFLINILGNNHHPVERHQASLLRTVEAAGKISPF